MNNQMNNTELKIPPPFFQMQQISHWFHRKKQSQVLITKCIYRIGCLIDFKT